jgi:hypothetical protein
MIAVVLIFATLILHGELYRPDKNWGVERLAKLPPSYDMDEQGLHDRVSEVGQPEVMDTTTYPVTE